MADATAPSERGRLDAKQVEVLLRPLNPKRVLQKQGQSHLPQYDVTAHLTRMFGFEGWDKEILDFRCIHEHLGHHADESKKGWYVTYLCRMRLTVYTPDGKVAAVREDVATGSAQNYPHVGDAHDFAAKNAVSYALKRCAKDWGDQFGLSLYNKGATGALVQKLVLTDSTEPDIPTPQTLGHDELETDEHDETPDAGNREPAADETPEHPLRDDGWTSDEERAAAHKPVIEAWRALSDAVKEPVRAKLAEHGYKQPPFPKVIFDWWKQAVETLERADTTPAPTGVDDWVKGIELLMSRLTADQATAYVAWLEAEKLPTETTRITKLEDAEKVYGYLESVLTAGMAGSTTNP